MTEQAYIRVDPSIQGGEPCIGGTRLPALQMARVWWHSGYTTWEQVQHEYPTLTREGLIVACWFVVQGSVGWKRVWGQWERRVEGALAEGRYDDVPLPPQKGGDVHATPAAGLGEDAGGGRG